MTYFWLGYAVGSISMMVLWQFSEYMYRRLLVRKSEECEVEFIHGKFICLVPEHKYNELCTIARRASDAGLLKEAAEAAGKGER